ncbi:MAG: DUF4230 domain-containing protein [Planctomycetota bacterium]
MLEILLIIVLALALGGAAVGLLLYMRRAGEKAPIRVLATDMVAERVRSVGKLVALEVHAKEIATTTKGWGWLPPIILTQAKIAMVFTFDKQYFVELGRLREEDVTEVEPGKFTVRLPAVEGSLRLADVRPYDIQAGRLMGLLEVIPMNANTQGALMEAAKEQAAELFARSEGRYQHEAQQAIARQVKALLKLFDAEVTIEWGDRTPESIARDDMQLGERVREALEAGAAQG